MELPNLQRLFPAALALVIGFLLVDTGMSFLEEFFIDANGMVATYENLILGFWFYGGYLAIVFYTTKWYFAASPRGIIAGLMVGFFFCCVILVFILTWRIFSTGLDAFVTDIDYGRALAELMLITALLGGYYARKQ